MGRFRDALTGDRRIDPDVLLDRVAAVRRFLDLVEGHLPDERLGPAHTLVERAGDRLALSRDHTVVALAGATGSGKSSLFNALARIDLSPVGVRRPTTGVTYACVWGAPDGAGRLLDWLGVLPRNRFVRESALDAEDEAGLRGLVLLDLPDFDSVQHAHRREVDRLLGLVDLVVWVVDPQKYADRVVHESYLREFHRHRDVTVVVLNQTDLLPPADVQRVLADLRRLLDDDGLSGVPVLATSAVDPAALTDLHAALQTTVGERQAALRRLSGDADAVLDELAPMMDASSPPDDLDRTSLPRLTDALAGVAGVSAVVEATEKAYRHRAAGSTGWPLVRGWRRLRPDPLRRLHLPGPASGAGAGATEPAVEHPIPATSVPDPTAAQRSAVGLAVRRVADRAGHGLPEPWPDAVAAAARSRLADLPDALDGAIGSTDLGLRRKPVWWRLVSGVQWLVTLAAAGGLGWLIVGYAVRALGLPPLEYPMIGQVPLPTLLLLAGLLAGLLLGLLARPLITLGARRARRRAQRRLRAAVSVVADGYVIKPVRAVRTAYEQAREALLAARSAR
ncbi:GTPase [Plantactinospora sp. KBS50]|uniref:GTPase n=1 Tax=Plantactinospora sp. KBS50 TaxID=2024580 RepID=UPI000BAAA5D9|nr:GTPase [Plantactinospora sp. KBS50]ASW53019.1 ABC transporter [Plantactinospora sp. KBS50]